MPIIYVIQTIKKIYPNSVILVKVGMFYNVYGRDSYILSYLFGYQLKQFQDTYMCGFPSESISKVMAKLENKKINYLIVDRRNNYDVDEKIENGNLNEYEKNFEKAKEYIKSKKHVEKIYKYLLQNLNNRNLINNIEKVIANEGRKV